MPPRSDAAVFVCGTAAEAEECGVSSCGQRPRGKSHARCAFALRGKAQGRTCGMVLCPGHQHVVDGLVVCPPHAGMLNAERARRAA